MIERTSKLFYFVRPKPTLEHSPWTLEHCVINRTLVAIKRTSRLPYSCTFTLNCMVPRSSASSQSTPIDLKQRSIVFDFFFCLLLFLFICLFYLPIFYILSIIISFYCFCLFLFILFIFFFCKMVIVSCGIIVY